MLIIPTWQERLGITADSDPDGIDPRQILRFMQAEIDDLRAAVSSLNGIVEIASRVSVADQSDEIGECCEALDELKKALRPWRTERAKK